MKTRKLNLSELTPYHKNARRGNVDAIAESLQVNGQYKPIIVNEGTHTGRPMEILVGNHTVQAAELIGLDKLDAVVIDVDDERARKIVLVDNRTSDLATYDDALLADLLVDADLSGTGFTDIDLDHLLAAAAPKPEVEADDVPEMREDTRVSTADVWILGRHRLVCGDSTDGAVFATLMGDDQADCLWTDPPYGVEYVGKTKEALTIENDGAAGLSDLLAGAFELSAQYLRGGHRSILRTPTQSESRSSTRRAPQGWVCGRTSYG